MMRFTRSDYHRESALSSIASCDPDYPSPTEITSILADPANDHLLRYVASDAFTHVFPGDQADHSADAFFADLNSELSTAPEFHLWAEVPLCRYRCHFCQFPVLVLNHDDDQTAHTARRWVDANIAEARLWLQAVPALGRTPVGEFCLFGGTPTAIPMPELERLVDFYTDAFNFTPNSSLRAEGSPDSLTPQVLRSLRSTGFDVLTYGIQSFDDALLELANRRHTGAQAAHAIEEARRVGFRRVDGDLVWGLPGQTVAGFSADVQQMIDLGFDTIVAIKLHLRPFEDVDSAIGHVRPAPWELPQVRRRLADAGHRWPSLGQQYQMRQAAVQLLDHAGHREHPTTYFPHHTVGAERWRALNLDQDKQYPQVGIGLGGYTWSSRSEANITPHPATYLSTIDNGKLPLETITAVTSDHEQAVRAIRMALSTCRPLRDDLHRDRYGSSLFEAPWAQIFADMTRRGLTTIDRTAGLVELTSAGRTLVEALINTEIR